jgi:hypothetical protein
VTPTLAQRLSGVPRHLAFGDDVGRAHEPRLELAPSHLPSERDSRKAETVTRLGQREFLRHLLVEVLRDVGASLVDKALLLGDALRVARRLGAIKRALESCDVAAVHLLELVVHLGSPSLLSAVCHGRNVRATVHVVKRYSA